MKHFRVDGTKTDEWGNLLGEPIDDAARDMRAKNQAAFETMMDAMVRLSFPESDWRSYAEKHFGPNGIKLEDVFESPRNPLIIGNPHHQDPLDPENNQ